MLIKCPSCGYSEEIDNTQLPNNCKTVKCKKCNTRFDMIGDKESIIPQDVRSISKICPNCNYTGPQEFKICPLCGGTLKGGVQSKIESHVFKEPNKTKQKGCNSNNISSINTNNNNNSIKTSTTYDQLDILNKLVNCKEIYIGSAVILILLMIASGSMGGFDLLLGTTIGIGPFFIAGIIFIFYKIKESEVEEMVAEASPYGKIYPLHVILKKFTYGDLCKVKIVGGDLQVGRWDPWNNDPFVVWRYDVDNKCLVKIVGIGKRFRIGRKSKVTEVVPVENNIKSLDLLQSVSERDTSHMITRGIAGGVMFGPAGAIVGGALGVEQKNIVTIACQLNDGRNFVAEISSSLYSQIYALLLPCANHS